MIKYYLLKLLYIANPVLLLVLSYACIHIYIEFGNPEYGYVMLYSVILPQISYIWSLIFYIFIFYKKYRFNILYPLFFIFYGLHLVLYVLFFILNNVDNVGEHYFFFGIVPNQLYPILELLFISFFIIIVFKKNVFLSRYSFALACAVTDIGIKLYLAQGSVINALFYFNKVYYDNYYYLIALCFALIQLFIEAYYFYQKEKPKWIRYNRLKLYKNTQIKN